MKIQCSCGAKYAFDLSPEMAQNPVRFVCPTCGLDSSEYVNQLVQAELKEQFPEAAPPPLPPGAAPRLKISHVPKPAEPPPEAAPSSKYCQKHRGVPVTEKCALCGKPICPQCLELFGFFCSPLCKNKADLKGVAVPVYAGQKFEVERQFWRKTGLIFGAIAAGLVLLLGVWIWYAWFGSVPHSYFTVRFEDNDRAYSGKSQLVGKDQLVFLHGGTLARYDLKTKKPVWSQELISPADIAAAVKAEGDAIARAVADGGYVHRRTQESLEKSARIAFQSELLLRVSGQDIWVGKGDKLTHHDWATGRVVREITLPETGGALIEGDGELLMLGDASVTHVSLATGDTRVEQFRPAGAATTVAVAGNTAGGGLSLSGNPGGQPLDPNKIAAQAQNLKLPAKIALPALLANASHEQQLEAALNDNPPPPRTKSFTALPVGAENFQLVPAPNGFVQFSAKLLEERFTTRTATKAPPKKSALEGEVNASKTGEIANEILNEMQRNNGGDTVTEDESRYLVTVHLPDSASTPDWTAEMVGPPQLFPLKTVNVVAAGKTIVVLDKQNKKVWSATLTYSVSGGGGLFRDESKYGEGPCVERGDTLYVFDQAVLSAFELTTGNARWRLPSVGVMGLFFDNQGSVYVNTTSGNPDDIKYSRQIDINKSTEDILMKVDPQTGKTLWSIKPGGFISYLSGKYIYTTQSYDPNPTDEEAENDLMIQKPAYFRIARINPKNGRVMWEYYDARDRCPSDVWFKDNVITLIFKREVQVLKYLSF